MSARRLDFDVVRCAAMVGVIAIHVSAPLISEPTSRAGWTGALVLNAIVRWSVPAFVMVSGALLLSSTRQESWLAFVRRTLPRLAVPFLAWSAVYVVLTVVVQDERVGLGQVLRMPVTGSAYTHLWFMPMLCGVYLAIPLVRRVLRRLGERGALLLLIGWFVAFCSAPFVAAATDNDYALALHFVPFVGYAILGWWLNHRTTWSPAVAVSVFATGALFATGTSWLANEDRVGGLLSRTSGVALDPTYFSYFSPGVVAMAVAVFQLARVVAPRMPARVGRLLVRISAVSFGVYLVHPLFIAASHKLKAGGRVYDATLFTPWLSIPVMVTLVAIAATVTVHVLQRQRSTAWLVTT